MTRTRVSSSFADRINHAIFVAKPFPPIPAGAWRLFTALQAVLMAAALLGGSAVAVPALGVSLLTLVITGCWRYWQQDVLRGVFTQAIYAYAIWTFVSAGMAYAAGDAVPSWWGDVLMLFAFSLLVFTSTRTAQLRGPHDRDSWIDAGIFAVSMGAPIWAFWVAPELTEGNPTPALFGLVYVAVLFSGARLVLGGGHWMAAVYASTIGGSIVGLIDFAIRGPLQLALPPWAPAAPAAVFASVVFLHPSTVLFYERGIRVGGLSIHTRLGLLACSVTLPMAVLAAGFIHGSEIEWGVYAVVFVLTAVAVAIRIDLTRRAGLSVWRPGALAAGATMVLFAVTGVLAALGQSAEQRRTDAAGLSDAVIALQPLDGLMVRAASFDPGTNERIAARTEFQRQLDEARAALTELVIMPGTREAAAGISADLQTFVEAARAELGQQAGAASAAKSAAAHQQVVGTAEAAAGVARQEATDRARVTRTVTVLLAALTLMLVAGLLLAYGAMQRRADLAARDAVDELTGLGSRNALLRHLRDRLDDDGALARGENVAVVSVDIVDGRRFRDSLGDAAYRDLLRGVADRLLTVVRDDDVVSRPRNDGFAVALASRAVDAEATVVAQRIVGAFAEPVLVEGRPHTVTISIGIAFATDVPGDEPGVRAAHLLRNGDLAAGDGGRSDRGIRVFAPAMEAAARERIELAAELRRGMERGELRLFYQPLIDLGTGLPTGYEALMRWQHPTRGLVSPGVFIPVAERAGLIGELGGWALKEACRQMAEWQPSWGDVRHMSVNVAAAQLQDGELLQQVTDALEESGLDASQLQLEVTESSLMEDVDAADKIMRQVQMLGVRWALDDFGTGYSSLSYLRRFPVQVLKIDKSFIDDITDDDIGGPLVAGIIDMARNLRLTVVAEGIEEIDQGMRVRGMGGDIGQGFLFSRPLPPEQVFELGRSSALPKPPPEQSGHLRIAT